MEAINFTPKELLKTMWTAQAQFRDLRAKSATDKSLVSSKEEVSQLLGHSSVNMTKRVYIKRRKEIDPFEEGVVNKNK